MTYQMFILCVVLSVAKSGIAVTVIINGTEVDCNEQCACCKGGPTACEYNDHCKNGCVETVFSFKCLKRCRGNCYTCQQLSGESCHTCQKSFFDLNSNCKKTCSVGCNGGDCNDQDGTCSCRELFKGERCDACVDGRYGSTCDQVCSVGCATLSCDKNIGSCGCNANFTGNKCDESRDGFNDSISFTKVYEGLEGKTDSKLSISVQLFAGMLVVGIIIAVIATVVVLQILQRKKGRNAINWIQTSDMIETDQTGFNQMYENIDGKTREPQQIH